MLEGIFSAAGTLAMAGWLLLAVLPSWRGIAQLVAGVIIPAVLSAGYLVLIAVWWSRAEGGFATLADVATLLASPPILLAGWVHYLAFDLAIGAWIARDARRRGIRHAMVLPLLPLTLMFGPIGYLAYLALRSARGLVETARAFVGREPRLVTAGLIGLAAMLPTLVAYALDDRTLGGVNVWIKPLKFQAALSLHLLTLAWFMPLAGAGFAATWLGRLVVWGALVPSVLEVLYIGWRASRGEASHYNLDIPFLYPLMGVGAVMLTAAAPALAWGIARAKAITVDPAYRLSVILGLCLTFVLGVAGGVVMSRGTSALVGVPLPGDAGIPLFGWRRTVGDLRVAHFLGIHAMQILPAVGFAAAMRAGARARMVVIAAALLLTLLAVAAFTQALLGFPAFPMP